MLLFPGGHLRHGGELITSGTRYIIAAFLFLGLEGGSDDAEADTSGRSDGFKFGFYS
jgi:hypothetical protein